MDDFKKKTCAAIVLAGGKGTRMHTDTAKQYLLLCGKPLLYYSLCAFENSFVNKIILVTGEDEISHCRTEIVEKYKFKKVTQIVAGGKERYHSTAAGLAALEQEECDYVFIHDGARPFVTDEILKRAYETVQSCQTAVTAMPVKDTIKVADKEGFATETPNRNSLYLIQTPQTFSFHSINNAYHKLLEHEADLEQRGIQITDDAMVMETFGEHRIRLIEGSYRNIKITTPEDLIVAEALLQG